MSHSFFCWFQWCNFHIFIFKFYYYLILIIFIIIFIFIFIIIYIYFHNYIYFYYYSIFTFKFYNYNNLWSRQFLRDAQRSPSLTECVSKSIEDNLYTLYMSQICFKLAIQWHNYLAWELSEKKNIFHHFHKNFLILVYSCFPIIWHTHTHIYIYICVCVVCIIRYTHMIIIREHENIPRFCNFSRKWQKNNFSFFH